MVQWCHVKEIFKTCFFLFVPFVLVFMIECGFARGTLQMLRRTEMRIQSLQWRCHHQVKQWPPRWKYHFFVRFQIVSPTLPGVFMFFHLQFLYFFLGQPNMCWSSNFSGWSQRSGEGHVNALNSSSSAPFFLPRRCGTEVSRSWMWR